MDKRILIHIEPRAPIRSIDLEHILASIRLLCQEEFAQKTEKSKRAFTDCVCINQIDKGSIVLDMQINIPVMIEVALLSFSIGRLVIQKLCFSDKSRNATQNGNGNIQINGDVTINNNNYQTNNITIYADKKNDGYIEQFLFSAINNGNTVTIVEEDKAVKLSKGADKDCINLSVVESPADNNAYSPISKAMNGEGFEALKSMFGDNK